MKETQPPTPDPRAAKTREKIKGNIACLDPSIEVI